jgi:hypothetical protein
MLKLARKAAAATLLSGMLSVGVAAPAMAQQNGLVNVDVGNVTILKNVGVGLAANVAATICGVKVGPVVILATQVDASGGSAILCDADAGPAVSNVVIRD